MPSNLRLIFKNENFETVYVLVQGSNGLNYNELEWESVFHKQDTFSLRIGVKEPKLIAPLLNKDVVYVVRNDTRQIAHINVKEFEDGQYLNISGIGVEGLLAKRFTNEQEFIPTGENLGQNYVGRVMCDIINANRPFPWLIADRDSNSHGISIYASTKDTGNVYKTLTTLSKAYDVGFSCLYDEVTNKVHFTTIPVVPMSTVIDGRAYRFSDDIGNVKGIKYEHDSSKYYNYIRMIGENGITAIVDISDGREVYEISKKSRTRQRDMSVVEYQKLLEAEGVEELSKRIANEVFTVEPKITADFKLGWEALSMTKHLDISTISFCTEIKDEFAESGYKKEYTFGYPVDMQEDFVTSLTGEFE